MASLCPACEGDGIKLPPYLQELSPGRYPSVVNLGRGAGGF